MKLKELGFTEKLEAKFLEHNWAEFEIGRVISEHKDRYLVRCEDATYDCEVLGNIRYTAQSRLDFPAVGDWLAISPYDEGKALIHGILPRYSSLIRKAVGQLSKVQLIATNVDYGIIVQAIDRDFNLNRLERYLTICNDARIEPIIVLSKIDLLDAKALESIYNQISQRVKSYDILKVSSELEDGYVEVVDRLISGKTYCLLGSSGVGKSTLLNHLKGSKVMSVGEISDAVSKGRHTTTHRELIVLDSGGIIIDNPGMRELGMIEGATGLEETFQDLYALGYSCKYSDCKHINENGCAVLKALDEGELDEESYHNYLKLEKEKEHFQASKVERRKKDRQLGKLYKSVQKHKQNRKYK